MREKGQLTMNNEQCCCSRAYSLPPRLDRKPRSLLSIKFSYFAFPFLVAVLLLCAMPVFSASLEELVGTQRAAALHGRTSPLTEVQVKKEPLPVLVPNHGRIKPLISTIRSSLQPSVMVESLYLYPKPQGAVTAGGWTEAHRVKLFNQALGISTLAGTQYFSASRNEMRTFYETSQIIDGPANKKPLPDPAYSEIPASLTLYARQKDLTFGDNIYQYDYYSYPDAFVFVQENITAMNAGIIPALGKNKLRSVVAVCDTGDSLLIYAASLAKAVALPGMDSRIGDSFSNRAEAILKWFTDRAERALQ